MCDCPDMHNKHAIYILLLSPILGGLLLAVAEQIPFAGFLFMSRVTSCLLLVVTACLWVRIAGYMLAENGSLWTGFYGYRKDLWFNQQTNFYDRKHYNKNRIHFPLIASQ